MSSRNKLCAAALAVSAMIAPLAAYGQGILLTPQPGAAPPAPALTPSPPPPPPPPPRAPSRAAVAIEFTELRTLDGWEVGAARRETALANTLWRESDAVPVGALFDKLTAPFASPVASRMARAALLSPGAAPAGSEAAANEAARKRFAALGRYGAAEEIAVMAASSPQVLADPNIVTFLAQAELARGRPAEACRRAQSITQGEIPGFLLRVRAYCFAAAGEAAATDLAIELARSSGVADSFLFSALPVLASGVGTKPAGRFDTSLNAAVSLAAKLPVSATSLNNASALALGVVVRSADAPPALRAQAAEIALRQGVIGADLARPALAGAIGVAQARNGPPIPALVAVLKTANDADGDLARAPLIEAALLKARTYPEFAAGARLFQAEIAGTPRTAAAAAASPGFARAALALNEGRLAAEWRNLIAQSPTPPPEVQRTALDAALVAIGQGGADARVVIERRIDLGIGPSAPWAARDVTLLNALGVATPPNAGAFVASNPVPAAAALRKADPAVLAALVSAAQRKAVGETTLNAALIIGPGAEKLDTDSLVSVIQALRQAGLEDFARAVAVEAMIAGGLK